MNKKKLSTVVGWTIEIIEMALGCIWTIIFGLCALMGSINYKEFGIIVVILMWVITLPGLIPILDSRRRMKKRLERERREKWEAQRNMNLNTSKVFEEMAAMTTAMGDMLQKSFSTVNQGMQGQDSKSVQTGAEGDKQGKMITCTCPHCNGINHIQAGKTEACEYCGSVIKA